MLENNKKIMAIVFWLGLVAYFIIGVGVANAQRTGKAPYVAQFGINQQELNSGAHFKVTNTDENDIVFALVDYHTDNVVAHIFISAKETYTFFDLPKGSYKYKFSNAGSYFADEDRMTLTGCDSDKYHCDRENWPYEKSLEVWVYQSAGKGDSEQISKDEFFKG